MAQKVSIRFFDDSLVRAAWDEAEGKWYFSVTDVIGVLNSEVSYAKNRNYWKYLKGKLKAEAPEVVSGTNQLKFEAPNFRGD